MSFVAILYVHLTTFNDSLLILLFFWFYFIRINLIDVIVCFSVCLFYFDFFCSCTDAYREYEQTEVNLRGTLSKTAPGVILDTTRENISSLLALAAE